MSKWKKKYSKLLMSNLYIKKRKWYIFLKTLYVLENHKMLFYMKRVRYKCIFFLEKENGNPICYIYS